MDSRGREGPPRWRHRFDLSVYLVVDPGMAAKTGLCATVAAAVAGGATMVQLRCKDAQLRDFLESARRLKEALRPLQVPLIVNDRLDVALAVGADGLHVGQDDMPVADARRLMGPDAIIGLSVRTLAQAREADAGIVDYVGIGPAYATMTKSDAARPLGPDGFRAVREAVALPAVAIGGIDATNAAPLIRAGADGVAVVSAICAAANPEAAARALAESVALARSASATERGTG